MWLLFACVPSEPVPTSGEFTALTYNVHGLPPEITGDDTAGRMEQIAPLLAPFDVVGLQEDFDDDNHDTLTAESGHDVNLRFSELVDDDRFYGSGLAMLSNLPLSDHLHEHFDLCNGTLDGAGDCLASKGFQVAVLELGDRQLHVYNTHMEAGNGELDDAARTRHVDQLLAAMEGFSSGADAVLLIGDTNLNDDDPEDWVEIQRLNAFGLQDSCELIGCDTPGRIDRFMLKSTGGLELLILDYEVLPWQDADGVDLSDHEPIVTTWSWGAVGD